VLQCGCEAADVCDHAATHDQHRFVARHAIVFQFNQYLFNIRDVLVGFIAVVHQLDAFDAKVLEVSVQFVALVHDYLVAYNAHAPAKGLLHVGEKMVGSLKYIVGDFDGCRECS